MSIENELNGLDFSIDKSSLYREETITDMRSGTIRLMTPLLPDGGEDKGRASVYIGSTTLMTPQGPLPIQARLMANNFDEALNVFPGTMRKAVEQFIEEARKIQEKEESRIITP